MKTEEIRQKLFENRDKKYQSFHSKLIPNIPSETVIGVRTPVLRKLAKEAYLDGYDEFLADLPHKYYDENQLHFFIVGMIKDYDACIKRVEEFLPYVDNWAVCDQAGFKQFEPHKSELLEKIRLWITSEHTYTIRFAVNMLMKFYLDDDFDEEYPKMVSAVKNDDYYVKMVVAWYFATALAKQYDSIIPYIEEHRLEEWTHRKTIQKAIESYRITDEQKAYLRTLK